MSKTVRNIVIILAIAAIVVIVPGGGTGASVVTQAVSLAFLASLVWFASVMYRQHRLTLYSLGDGRRAILYVAAAVAAVVLTGTHKLWSSSGGEVAWLVLLGGAIYAVFAILWAARKY
jgi:glucose-6-phosphate-specific signal transduction histidine kinase